MKLDEFRCHFREVGRATVPADTGRHGGRPYSKIGVLVAYQWYYKNDPLPLTMSHQL